MPLLRPRAISPADVQRARQARVAWEARRPVGGAFAAPEAEGPAPPPPAPPEDPYLAKVIKYIPAEIVGAYLTGQGAIEQMAVHSAVPWVWSGLLLVLCPLWIAYATQGPDEPVAWPQVVAAPIAFLAWVFAMGGPFKQFEWYQPGLGSLAMIVVTLFLPLSERIFFRKGPDVG